MNDLATSPINHACLYFQDLVKNTLKSEVNHKMTCSWDMNISEKRTTYFWDLCSRGLSKQVCKECLWPPYKEAKIKMLCTTPHPLETLCYTPYV